MTKRLQKFRSPIQIQRDFQYKAELWLMLASSTKVRYTCRSCLWWSIITSTWICLYVMFDCHTWRLCSGLLACRISAASGVHCSWSSILSWVFKNLLRFWAVTWQTVIKLSVTVKSSFSWNKGIFLTRCKSCTSTANLYEFKNTFQFIPLLENTM